MLCLACLTFVEGTRGPGQMPLYFCVPFGPRGPLLLTQVFCVLLGDSR